MGAKRDRSRRTGNYPCPLKQKRSHLTGDHQAEHKASCHCFRHPVSLHITWAYLPMCQQIQVITCKRVATACDFSHRIMGGWARPADHFTGQTEKAKGLLIYSITQVAIGLPPHGVRSMVAPCCCLLSPGQIYCLPGCNVFNFGKLCVWIKHACPYTQFICHFISHEHSRVKQHLFVR